MADHTHVSIRKSAEYEGRLYCKAPACKYKTGLSASWVDASWSYLCHLESKAEGKATGHPPANVFAVWRAQYDSENAPPAARPGFAAATGKPLWWDPSYMAEEPPPIFKATQVKKAAKDGWEDGRWSSSSRHRSRSRHHRSAPPLVGLAGFLEDVDGWTAKATAKEYAPSTLRSTASRPPARSF